MKHISGFNPISGNSEYPYHIRQAVVEDHYKIDQMVENAVFFYRHLDWISPLDWLGKQPFYVIEDDEEKILAALACPPEPKDLYWVRLFAVSSKIRPSKAWKILFHEMIRSPILLDGSSINILVINDTLKNILIDNDFSHYQNIKVLIKNDQEKINLPALKDLEIRKMRITDISSVFNIDHKAFKGIWQMSSEALKHALIKASYSTIALYKNSIVGYQMCTASDDNCHLARLAVKPDFQRLSIGTYLLYDIFAYWSSLGYKSITVNTQSNNLASLSLYHKVGFRPTGEEFPIYRYTHKL